MSGDFLQKFIFEDIPFKGSFVRLSSAWQEVLRRARPAAVTENLLGEALCSSVLLTSNIKFRGSVSLQIQSRGAVRLLLGQCNHKGELRGIARMREKMRLPVLQEAILAINLEPESGGKPYQGIVEMGEGGLSIALENYFRQSEQLDTRFWFATDSVQCSGLMLQKMPEKAADPDDWQRLRLLAGSLTPEELQTLQCEQLIRALFHQDNVRLFSAAPLRFACSCSRQKVSGVLLSLGQAEILELVEERGLVEVFCEYCGRDYQFDRIDVGRLFAAEFAAIPDSPGIH